MYLTKDWVRSTEDIEKTEMKIAKTMPKTLSLFVNVPLIIHLFPFTLIRANQFKTVTDFQIHI